jgi:hypothetical protein
MTSVRIENQNPYGSLDKTKLHSFEASLGFRLPADYRKFLIEFNGGKPDPEFFWIIENQDGTGVQQFYGLHDGPEPFSIDTYAGENRYGIPYGLLVIGDDGVGNYMCIGINEDNFGKVFFLDHEVHPFHDLNSMEGVKKIADSFDEFLGLLHPEDE